MAKFPEKSSKTYSIKILTSLTSVILGNDVGILLPPNI